MNQCQTKILAEGNHFNVSYCGCCKRIGLFYNNILSGFDVIEFEHFSEGVQSLNFNEGAILFPNHELYIMVTTCHPDVQFCFNHDEFSQFQNLMEEARLMLDVYTALEA